MLVNFEENCMVYTVKNYRNFTDPVMGNCDKKSTGNRKFTGKCPYILYINGQFTVLLQIFRKFTGKSPGKFTIPRTFLIAITHYGVHKTTLIF